MADPGFTELKQIVEKTVLARRITLGVFAAVALIVILTSGISYLNPLFYAPFIWFLTTFPFQALVKRIDNARALHWAQTGFFLVEIVIVTLFVYLTGGSQWIGNIFYLFTVIYANFFLPPLQGGLVTALVVFLYALVVLLEYVGIIPHRQLFPALAAGYKSLSYDLATILVGAVGFYSLLAYTVRAFTQIYDRKNRILGERERELTTLSQRLLSAQEEERRRIARELHDHLSQSLAAVKLRLAALSGALPETDRSEVLTIVDQAIDETRTLAYSLRPPLLDDLGLVPSLHRLAEMVGAGGGLEIDVDVAPGERLPNLPVETLLFHVAQEALANVKRHAHARTVTIRLSETSLGIRLSVSDDGIGFHPEDAQGLGLRGIRERVEGSGGRMNLVSAPGNGTTLTVEVPCGPPAARDRG